MGAMGVWGFLSFSLVATLVLAGLVAMVVGISKRRLAGTAEVAAELSAAMLDFDPASITVAENQRAALALSQNHLQAYLVHTLGDGIVTRVLDAKRLRCVETREGLRLIFNDLAAAPVLLYLPTAMTRHWLEIFKVLKHA